MDFKGLYSVLVTPFDEHLELDEKGLQENIQFQIRERVQGIVVLGTTGEAPTLSSEEQDRIVLIAKEETSGKVPLVVGTGSYSTSDTIKKTLKAKKLGADAVLIVTPYYNKPTQEGLYLHFKAIAEACDIPIIIYNIQGRTGQNLQTATLKRLAEIPSIVGVKEASGSVPQMMEVIATMREFRPGFKVLSGDDALTFPLMALGGHGVLSVVSNIIPRTLSEFVENLLQGNFSKAREMHYHLMPLFSAAFIETNPIPIKAAMRHLGYPAGGCRLPLCDLQPSSLDHLQRAMEKYTSDVCFNALNC